MDKNDKGKGAESEMELAGPRAANSTTELVPTKDVSIKDMRGEQI